MANVKISALPTTGVSTPDDYFVIDDAALTTTSKIQLKNFVGLISGTGTGSMMSAPHLTSGFPATGSGNYSITLGYGASGTSTNGIAIGYGAEATSPNSIAIGTRAYNANRDGFRDRYIAIGYEAQAVSDTFALGTNARALGTDVIALGNNAKGTGNGQISIGGNAEGDGTNLVVIGKNSGGSGINLNNSIIIGASNTMTDNTEKSILIGNGLTSGYNNGIAIGSDGQSVQGAHSVQIGGSGYTWSQIGSDGLVQLGGFNHSIPYAMDRNNIIGGQNCTFNGSAGLGNNNVFLGLSGRTIGAGSNTTFVENLGIYGGIQQSSTLYTGTTININVGTQGMVEISATDSGSTYNISIDPAPDNVGRTLQMHIEWVSGATINFVGSGSVQWKWNNNVPPVFSASTSSAVSRSIIVMNTWDGNDMWEVSRSMNME
jgi:hypothetical protein